MLYTATILFPFVKLVFVSKSRPKPVSFNTKFLISHGTFGLQITAPDFENFILAVFENSDNYVLVTFTVTRAKRSYASRSRTVGEDSRTRTYESDPGVRSRASNREAGSSCSSRKIFEQADKSTERILTHDSPGLRDARSRPWISTALYLVP